MLLTRLLADIGVVETRGPLDGVEHHRARVTALGSAHDVRTGPFRPQAELLAGGGPERVTGGQQDRGAGPRQTGGHLAQRGGLAHAVDTHEQPHVDRPCGLVVG